MITAQGKNNYEIDKNVLRFDENDIRFSEFGFLLEGQLFTEDYIEKVYKAGLNLITIENNTFAEEHYSHTNYVYSMNSILKQNLIKLSKVNLLIIDELGYLKMDKEKESIFFQLIRQRYEKSSLIITTNLPFNRWDEVFTSELAATAILDRLLHHSHVISITGDSYRVKRHLEEE